ncbi:hypothetical protein EMIT0P265_50203 [Pseudomonas zeae]
MSLLAIAVGQSNIYQLTHRYREQAHSYRGFASGWKYAGRPCTMAASETQPQEFTRHAR